MQEGCPHFLKDTCQSLFILLLITVGILFDDYLLLRPSLILTGQGNPAPWIRAGVCNEVAEPQPCIVAEGLSHSQLQSLETLVFR